MRKKLLLFLRLLPVILAGGCAVNGENELNIGRVFDAVQTLHGVVKTTDLMPAPGLSGRNEVYLKLETQQYTGSFKLRGAYYMISKLGPEEKKRGVVTCSTGNHAQGVGFAANKFGIRATVFLPASVPQTKADAVLAHNAALKFVDGSFDDALRAALDYQRETGAVYVPPFDHYDIIAGQGTIGWEILNQLPEADIIVVPIGGGGLISGIAFAAKTLKPSCRIYGVQAEAAAAMYRSREAGEIVTLDKAATIADGTAVKKPGEITFALCNRYVDRIVTVNEGEIKEAIRQMHKEYNIVAEGAGAVSVAAVMSGKIQAEGKRIVCVVSGGNIDPAKLEEILK